jgi:hypothetical protein
MEEISGLLCRQDAPARHENNRLPLRHGFDDELQSVERRCWHLDSGLGCVWADEEGPAITPVDLFDAIPKKL